MNQARTHMLEAANKPTWRRSSQTGKPRRASVVDLLVFFAVALAGYAGASAIVIAFSLRDIRFEPRTAMPGAAMLVQWHFFGLRVWQKRCPQIIDVEQKRIVTHAFDPGDPTQAERVHIRVNFLDQDGRPAFTVRNSSLIRNLPQIHRYLTGEGSDGLMVNETERWWSGSPVNNFTGGAVGLLLSLGIGTLFLIGGLSALWVRLTTR